MCVGETFLLAWYVNSQLRGLYQPSLFDVSPRVAFSPSAEPLASSHFYLLDSPSHVKDDEVDTLQAVDALAR